MRNGWFVVILAIAAGGCGKGKPPPADAADPRRPALAELGEAYKGFVEAKRRPPTPADFKQLDVTAPAAGPMLTAGDIVFLYGTSAGADPDTVLAYGKDAPSAGGPVLMQDGTVKDLTPDEFTNAKKAGTATRPRP